MPGPTGWRRIRGVLPDALAYAVDRSGMQCATNTVPYYHQTGKWIPTEGGRRVDLGLVDVPSDYDGRNSLQWAPDYEGDPQAHTRAQEQHDQAVSGRPNPSPQVRETDPKEKGPDAFGHPVTGAETAEGLESANRAALSKGAQASDQSVPAASATPVAPSDQLVQQLAELVLAIGDVLPKTRKFKVQKQLDEVSKLLKKE